VQHLHLPEKQRFPEKVEQRLLGEFVQRFPEELEH